jgi:hypothetical protein
MWELLVRKSCVNNRTLLGVQEINRNHGGKSTVGNAGIHVQLMICALSGASEHDTLE